MRITALILFCYFPFSSPATHSLQYFYTATSGVTDFPDFISVGVVDGVDFSYYVSNIQMSVPKQEWMKGMGQEYWQLETQLAQENHQTLKMDMPDVMQRFNQTGGVHTYQRMCGCQWEDETGATLSYDRYGFDGDDYLSLDMKQMRWIAAVPQAVPTKLKWQANRAEFEWLRHFLTQECPERLKKHVQYGSSTLQRKVRPNVSVLQKDSSSSVVCHATGFYPDGVMITWKREGVEMQEDVDVGETLPNEDGTFQKRVVLKVSPEERRKSQFTCEVAHKSGEPIIKTLPEEHYRSSDTTPNPSATERGFPLVIISGGVAAALVVVVAIVTVCVLMLKRKDFTKAYVSDDDGSSKKTAMLKGFNWPQHLSPQRSGEIPRTFSESSSDSASSTDSASSDQPLMKRK